MLIIYSLLGLVAMSALAIPFSSDEDASENEDLDISDDVDHAPIDEGTKDIPNVILNEIFSEDDKTISKDYSESPNLIPGSDSDDLVLGSDGRDEILGLRGNDTLFGAAGDDLIVSDEGQDVLMGNSGNDALHGRAGADTLNGGPGKDSLFGGDGQDVLRGGSGVDFLSGGEGDDTLYASSGDQLHGGNGADTLVISQSGTSQPVEIIDFDPDVDQIIVEVEDEGQQIDVTITSQASSPNISEIGLNGQIVAYVVSEIPPSISDIVFWEKASSND